ncbi:hypothetical protein C8R44DRAFT_892166 [Mycena epipterygia]|nr:hypothetical protein C8R44DRAFT_892166 [Mycena epipterygia]
MSSFRSKAVTTGRRCMTPSWVPDSTSKMPPTPPDAELLALHFDSDSVHCPGHTIEGTVTVNLRLAHAEAIEQVRIDFRGSMETALAEQPVLQTRTTEPFHLTELLWTKGKTIPSNFESMECPFRCKLPENLPPSFHCDFPEIQADVKYFIKVVATRGGIGLLNSNPHIIRNFTIFPAATPTQLSEKADLLKGWEGPWRTIAREKKMRRGIFDGEAQVRAEDPRPSLLPMGHRRSPLVHSGNTTKRMARSEPPRNEDLFPAPPTHSADVGLELCQTVHMRGDYISRVESNKYRMFGGLGDPASTKAVKCTIYEPEWVPQPGHKKQHGVWKRVVRFDSTISVSNTPTFKYESEGRPLDLRYALQFVVVFAGIGNSIEVEIPIGIHSAHA